VKKKRPCNLCQHLIHTENGEYCAAVIPSYLDVFFFLEEPAWPICPGFRLKKELEGKISREMLVARRKGKSQWFESKKIRDAISQLEALS